MGQSVEDDESEAEAQETDEEDSPKAKNQRKTKLVTKKEKANIEATSDEGED